MDNILQLNTIQEMKDKGIKLYSYNKDNYSWESIFISSGSYNTYEELNNDKSNDDYSVGYFLKTNIWNNWRQAVSKQEKNCAVISANIREKLNGKWQVGINIDCNIYHSMNDSPIIFNTRDEAAEAVQKWFDTYIFEDKDNNADRDELSQNNDLLNQIYDSLGE